MKTIQKSNFEKKFSKLALDLHGVRLPSFEIDIKDKRKIGVSEDIDNTEFLKALARAGFKKLGVKSLSLVQIEKLLQERFQEI